MNQGRMDKRTFQFIGATALLILLVIFILQNSQEQTVTLFFWKFNLPLFLVFFVCIFIGMLFSFVWFYPGHRRTHIAEKKLKECEEKHASLSSSNEQDKHNQ